jgi:glycopeptide antibiotics resistance protein
MTGPGTPRLRRLLQIYCAGFVLYAVMPLDFVTTLGDLQARLKNGAINWRPLAVLHWDLWTIFVLIKKAAYWIPIGLLYALPRAGDSLVPSLRRAMAGSISLLCTVELAQVFIRSRLADVTDIYMGIAGAAFGVWLARCLPWQRMYLLFTERSYYVRLITGAATLAYCVALVALFWYPFERIHDSDELRERAGRLFSLPFISLWAGSEVNALGQIVLKTGCFAVFGVLATVSLSVPSRAFEPSGRRCWAVVFLASALAAVIELGQIVFRYRYPDLFDVGFACVGATIGQTVVDYLQKPTAARASSQVIGLRGRTAALDFKSLPLPK